MVDTILGDREMHRMYPICSVLETGKKILVFKEACTGGTIRAAKKRSFQKWGF